MSKLPFNTKQIRQFLLLTITLAISLSPLLVSSTALAAGPNILSIIAGSVGNAGPTTPGPATSTDLNQPWELALDSSGNVYIADGGNYVIDKVTPSGTLSIFAGTGNAGTPTPGPATSSDIGHPYGVTVDSSGNVYIADSNNYVIEKVTPSGTLSIFAGTGNAGTPTPGPATSSDLGSSYGIAVDSSGYLYIADFDNSVIEKVTPSGTLSIFAGTGNNGPPTPGPATSSDLGAPSGVAVDISGNVYSADTYNNLIEKVTPSGTLSIFAGTGNVGAPTPGPATSSDLGYPGGVAVDKLGNVYIADYGNAVVEKVTVPATTTDTSNTSNSTSTPTAPNTGFGTPTHSNNNGLYLITSGAAVLIGLALLSRNRRTTYSLKWR